VCSARHWTASNYNRDTSVDRTALGLLLQLQVVHELADKLSAAEVAEHLKKAKRGKAPGENGLTVEYFQALGTRASLTSGALRRRASRGGASGDSRSCQRVEIPIYGALPHW
jgi:hypothetical protein